MADGASSGPVQPVAGVRPFRIKVPQKELSELRWRARATRRPDRETVGGRTLGAQSAKVRPLVEYWGTRYDRLLHFYYAGFGYAGFEAAHHCSLAASNAA
ncbi:epoxide hydrolase N-terminal domain-containing protein [Streptomyces sp. NPDC102467]|uniref:epoxide hydrolase N-terminal domain-containing protein n=1 Tax=Streptomyces sp. NPDC102467 TaxID=3366179 RepID=UPI00380FE115